MSKRERSRSIIGAYLGATVMAEMLGGFSSASPRQKDEKKCLYCGALYDHRGKFCTKECFEKHEAMKEEGK